MNIQQFRIDMTGIAVQKEKFLKKTIVLLLLISVFSVYLMAGTPDDTDDSNISVDLEMKGWRTGLLVFPGFDFFSWAPVPPTRYTLTETVGFLDADGLGLSLYAEQMLDYYKTDYYRTPNPNAAALGMDGLGGYAPFAEDALNPEYSEFWLSDIGWKLGLSYSLTAAVEDGPGPVDLFLDYSGLWRRNYEQVLFLQLFDDGPFNESLLFSSGLPDAVRILETGFSFGIRQEGLYNPLGDVEHFTEAGSEWNVTALLVPEFLNSSAAGAGAGYFKAEACMEHKLPLFDLDPASEYNVFSLQMETIVEAKFFAPMGGYVPVHARLGNRIAPEGVQLPASYASDTAFTFFHESWLVAAGPSLVIPVDFLKNIGLHEIRPMARLMVSTGYYQDAYGDEAPGFDTGRLMAAAGAQFFLRFFDFVEAGVKLYYDFSPATRAYYAAHPLIGDDGQAAGAPEFVIALHLD